jgi:hypothetical protein
MLACVGDADLLAFYLVVILGRNAGERPTLPTCYPRLGNPKNTEKSVCATFSARPR